MNAVNCGVVAAGAIVVAGLVTSSAHANLLANPGFESPITSDGPPFVGSWEGFNGGAGSLATNATVMPRSGLQHLQLSIFNTDNTFAGTFQDVPGLTPGTMATFSGWHKTTTSPLDLDAEVRIEWRNSVSNTEISRTPNLVPIPTADYTMFSLSAMIPAGADTARVVYAIQTFSGGPTNNGTVFVDDVSFIPAPATIVMAMGGLLGLAGQRRRRD